MATPTNASLPEENPLVKAETDRYVRDQKRADTYKNISEYLFWGATTVLGGLAAVAVGLATLATPLIWAGVAATLVTFAGSVLCSRTAKEIEENANVLYSDIDSQQQSHRMVQAFAKAQSQGKLAETGPVAMIEDASHATSEVKWADKFASRAGAAQSEGNWVNYITQQAAAEDQAKLAGLTGGRS